MLYNDSVMDKVINRTESMVQRNSVEHLGIGYKAAKDYLKGARTWRKTDLTPSIEEDISRCVRYCSIIDRLRGQRLIMGSEEPAPSETTTQ